MAMLVWWFGVFSSCFPQPDVSLPTSSLHADRGCTLAPTPLTWDMFMCGEWVSWLAAEGSFVSRVYLAMHDASRSAIDNVLSLRIGLSNSKLRMYVGAPLSMTLDVVSRLVSFFWPPSAHPLRSWVPRNTETGTCDSRLSYTNASQSELLLGATIYQLRNLIFTDIGLIDFSVCSATDRIATQSRRDDHIKSKQTT
jgi:hypothetical protein